MSAHVEDPSDQQQPPPKWPPSSFVQVISSELGKQRGLAIPLMVMNLAWFGKIAITTSFLGRLGELQLAGGTLGFTFANVTGFAVLTGLSGAMDPICGQAYGAKNFRLLHKTLFMAIFLLLLLNLPISFLWLNMDKILVYCGQPDDMIATAKSYLLFLIPDLVVTSFLCPLKSYLSSQGITVPIMLSSTLAVVFHVPITMFLSKSMGLQGVAMAVWVTDLIVTVLLASYVLIMEHRREESQKEGGWFEQGTQDWIKLLRLCGPCCLLTCLEWWCYEILILLTGRLPNATQAVGIIAIVFNFDYLLFSIMLSLSTCASTRVSNELGANQPNLAYRSACVSLGTGMISGCIGAAIMVGARGAWGHLFSHDKGVISGVKKMMLLMALIEVVNFPLAVSGGIIRGTARPWLGMFANLGGFYLLALPLGVVLAFKVGFGLGGLLLGFIVGAAVCLILLVIVIARIDWVREASKAQRRACKNEEKMKEQGGDGASECINHT